MEISLMVLNIHSFLDANLLLSYIYIHCHGYGSNWILVEKVALEEAKKFKIACPRIQIISNSPSVHEILVLQYKRLKKMDYLNNSPEWTQLWTEVFAVSSYLKRHSFNKTEQLNFTRSQMDWKIAKYI